MTDFSQRKGALTNPFSLVYNRKLDTALRDSFHVSLFHQIDHNSISIDNRMLINCCAPYGDLKTFDRSGDYYAKFLIKVLSVDGLLRPRGNERTTIDETYRLSKRLIEFQHNYLHDQNYTYSKEYIMRAKDLWMKKLSPRTEICNLFRVLTFVEQIIDKMNQLYGVQDKGDYDDYTSKTKGLSSSEYHALDLKFLWNKTFLVMIIDNEKYLLPRTCILLFHNKIADLISVLTFCNASVGTSIPEDGYEVTVSFVKVLARLLTRFRDKGYNILKVLEGLGIAETLTQEEKWDNTEFIDAISLDLIEKVRFDYNSSDMCRILRAVDTPMRHELMCLTKIVGHPFVNMREGGISLHKKTTCEKVIAPHAILSCINYMKRDYIKKYLSRKGKWPLVSFEPSTPKSLTMACLLQKDPDSNYIRRTYGENKIEYYVFLTLEKNESFHKLENIIPYLKDKTVSVLRSKVMEQYINQTNLKKSPQDTWKETRLLLLYLLAPSMARDPKKYLEKYINSDDLNDVLEYLVIRIVPKEKEMKIDFRGFGCKTYEDRYRCLVQEKNVALFLEENSDEQAMTISELTLLKRLDAFRRIKQAYKGYKPLYIVIDSSAWNNGFSSHTVDTVMEHTLDRLFDVKLFSKTHKAYEKTLFYIPDTEYIQWWEGQRGGIEGLNQYTWVTCYLGQIKVALQDFNLKYHIFCKGDDLRIVVLIPENEYTDTDVKNIKNRIVQTISTTLNNYGTKVNVEESYGSSSYFAFSKAASYNTIELPQTYRKIQKTYGANNSFINTFDDYVASTFSNGHSACKTCPNIMGCFFTSVSWAFHYICISPIFSDLSEDAKLCLLLIPSLLGGFPIIYLHNFHVRAESDLLSPFLGMVLYAKRFYPCLYDHMIKFCCSTISVPDTYLKLYSDPYSIPTDSPPLPSTILRNLIIPTLKRITKNKDLLALIKLEESNAMKDIIAALDSAKYKRVKALALLYGASPSGVIMSLVRKFESGKSILELLLLRMSRKKVHRFLIKVIQAENRLQKWRKEMITDKLRFNKHRYFYDLISPCPNYSADKVREYCWGTKIYDITMPPLQHQISLVSPYDPNHDLWSRENHFTYEICDITDCVSRDEREHYATGTYNPFVGYTTKSGTVDPVMHFIEKDILLNQVKTLIDLLSWVNTSYTHPNGIVEASNSLNIIERLLKIYTTQKLSVLAPFSAERKSGTAQHHMRSPSFRESIVPNTLSNTYTRISGETNSHKTLRTSGQHYRMNLLHIYCHVNLLIFDELNFSHKSHLLGSYWAVTTPCEVCNAPIYELPLVFNEGLVNLIDLDVLNITALPEIAQEIINKSLEAEGQRIPVTSGRGYLTMEIATRALLQDLLDKTYLERNRMQQRYGVSYLSEEGQNILSILGGSGRSHSVGLTEIKCMSLASLENFVFDMVIYYWYKRNNVQSDEDFRQWITVTPALEIPWYMCIVMVYNAGRLPALIRSIEQRSNIGSSGSYHNAASSACYIGLVGLQLYQDGVIVLCPDMVYLTHFQTQHILLFIKTCIDGSVSEIIKQQYMSVDLYKRCPSRGLTEMTRECIYILCLEVIRIIFLRTRDEAELDEIAQMLYEDTNHIVLNLNVDSDVDDIRFEDFICESVMSYKEGLSLDPKLKFAYNNFLKMDINEFDRLEEHIIEKFYEYRHRIKDIINEPEICKPINIHVVSLSEAINYVRANRQEVIDIDTISDNSSSTECTNLQTIEKITQLSLSAKHQDYIRLVLPIAHYQYCPSVAPYNELETQEGIEMEYKVINKDHFYDIIGLHNNCYVILIHILLSLGVKIGELSDMHVLCISDGLGGMSDVLGGFIKDSTIIFHTHKDTLETEVAPLLTVTHTNNSLIFDYLNEGYYNLAEDNVVDRIYHYASNSLIAISDLEYTPGLTSEYDLVLSNNLYTLLKCLSVHGLLIIKYQIKNVSGLARIIDSINNYFQEIYLMKPLGSIGYFYVYIVARDHQPSVINRKTIHFEVSQKKPSDTSVRYAAKYLRSVNKIFKDDIHRNLTGTNYNYFTLNHDHLSIFVSIFGNHNDTKLLRHMSLYFRDPAESRQRIANSYRETSSMKILDIFKQEGIDIVLSLKNLKKRLTKVFIDLSGQEYEPDTRGQRRILLLRLMTLSGFYYQIQNGGVPLCDCHVNTSILDSLFTRLVDSLSPRDKASFNITQSHEVRTGEDEHLYDIKYLEKNFYLGVRLYINTVSSIFCNNETRRHILSTKRVIPEEELA